jgi:transglutaminase-like putative cysteine protease
VPSTTLIKNPTLDDTLRVMIAKANEAKKTLRPLAEKICAKIESGSYNDEISAVYGWVRQNIKYRKDPHNVEYVRAPLRMVESGQGDCDDMACLLAALCMALGHECRFLVVGFEDMSPSHVFCQVAVRGVVMDGGGSKGAKDWVSLDPVADENTAQMHGRVRFVKTY